MRSLHIILLSTEIYPDVKRGGAIFARNLYHLLKGLLPKVEIVVLSHSRQMKHPDMILIKPPWHITSEFSFLISLPIYIFHSIWVLSKLKPHFVISNGVYDSLPPILARKPFAIVVHDTSALTFGVITRPLFLLSLKKARFVICPSQSVAKEISNYTSRIFILNNYITQDKFEKITRANSEVFFNRYPELRGKKIILFIGAYSSHKGIPALINSMKEVKRVVPDAFLVIAGPGSDQKKSNFNEGIIYAGVLEEDELISYLVATDIFVLPSVKSEGFGIALLEAMVARKPVIAGNLPAFKEVAEDAAIYVNGSDPKSIAQAITSLFLNDRLARSLSSKAYCQSKLFTEEKVKLQCVKLLEHIMKDIEIS